MMRKENGVLRKKRGVLRKVVLGAAVLVVLLIGAIAVFGPGVAASVGRRMAENAISQRFAGRAEIQGLTLSWSGPQQIEQVTLYDPKGSVVATMQGEVQGGLFALAFNPSSMRKITLSGSVDVVEDPQGNTNLAAALQHTDKIVHVDATKNATGERTPTHAPITVPQGLDLELDLSSLDVTYTADNHTVTLDDVSAQGVLKAGEPITLDVSCVNAGVLANGNPGHITGTVEVNDLIGASGQFTPVQTHGTASISAALPGQWAALAMSAAGIHSDLPAGDATFDIHMLVADGRITVVPDATTAFSIPAPADALIRASGATHIESINTDGPVVMRIQLLDVPLAGVLGERADWQGAKVEIVFEVPTIAAVATGVPGVVVGETARIDIPASTFSISTPGAVSGITANGALVASVNGETIGSIRLAATMRNIIDGTGALASDMSQAKMEGGLIVSGVPAPFVQRIAGVEDIDIARLFGGPIELTVDVSASADLGASGTNIEFAVKGPLTTAEGAMIWRGDRLDATGDGVRIESHASEYLRELMRFDREIQITGPELTLVTVPALSVPWTKPRGIVWSELRGSVSVMMQSLTLYSVDQGPLAIARVSGRMKIAKGDPIINMRAEGADGSAFFDADTTLTLLGGVDALRALEQGQAVAFDTLVASGVAGFVRVPMRIVSFVDPVRSRDLVTALGPIVDGNMTIEPGPNDGTGGARQTQVFCLLKSAYAGVHGTALISNETIESREGQPVSIVFHHPLQAASAFGIDASALLGPRVALDDAREMNIEFHQFVMPVDEPMAVLDSAIDATLVVGGAKIIAQVDEQTSTPINLRKVTAKMTKDIGADSPAHFSMQTQGSGSAGGAFDITGEVRGIGALLADDHTAAGGRTIVDATMTGETPSALLDAMAGADGLLVQMIGERATAEVHAQDVAIDRSAGKMTVSMKAPHAEVHIFGRFEDGALMLTNEEDADTSAALTRIDPMVSQRLLETLLPLFTSFEKVGGQRATMITTRHLSLPTDGDLRKLNGVISIDLGSMNFKAAPLLASVLEATSNNTEGMVLHNIEPVDIHIDTGVARYDDFTIPWGTFELTSRGSIDLVKKTMDVVAFVPLAGLGGDMQRAAQRFPGINALAVIPLRAKGALGSAQFQIDPELVAKNLPDLLEQTIGDLLNDAINGSKNDDKKKSNKKKNNGKKKKKITPPSDESPDEQPSNEEPPEDTKPPSRWGSPRPR